MHHQCFCIGIRKYGPWKEALREAWASIARPKCKTSSNGSLPADELERLRMQKFKVVIAKMCLKMKGQKFAAWQTHANRFRAREMGPAVALRGLGFSWRSGKPVSDEVPQLKKFIRTWDVLEKSIGAKAPHTISEGFEKMKAARRGAQGLPKAPRLCGNYLLPWHLRALLRDRMVSAGIPKLKINPDATIYQLLHLCPDQGKFLKKIQQYLTQTQNLKGLSVRDFISTAAEVDTPPELLSMWLASCKFINI